MANTRTAGRFRWAAFDVRAAPRLHLCGGEPRGSTRRHPRVDLLRGAVRSRTEPDPALFEPFNREADDGRRMERYSDLLNDAVRSMIEEKAGRDIDSLFAPGPTTALIGEVAGLDDYELIAFVMVREG